MSGLLAATGERALLPTRAVAGTPDRVVVINDISVMKGGATSIALTGARMLHERGVPVTFITGDDAGAVAPEHAALDFATLGGEHLLALSPAKAMLRGLYNRRAEVMLADWITRHDTPRTVYHLHGWSKILSPAVFRALRPVARRLAIHAHDFFLACPNGGYFDYKRGEVCERTPLSAACFARNCDKRNYLQKLWRSTRHATRKSLIDLARAGLVIPVHEGMLALLEQGGIPRRRMRVLRNPALAWCRERVAAEANRHFLYVGRFDTEKGVIALARAARRAGIQLRMAGAGPLELRLRQEFPEIELLGWRRPQELGELCRTARVLVTPSLVRETFGLVAFEALLSGIPVLASERMLIAGEIADNGLGLAGDPQDEAAFAGLLARLAGDDALVAACSARACAEAPRLVLTPDAWADALGDIYGSLLANSVAQHRGG